MNIISRREFLGMGLLALAATPALGNLSLPMAKKKGKMEVSLAEWSIHVELEKLITKWQIIAGTIDLYLLVM